MLSINWTVKFIINLKIFLIFLWEFHTCLSLTAPGPPHMAPSKFMFVTFFFNLQLVFLQFWGLGWACIQTLALIISEVMARWCENRQRKSISPLFQEPHEGSVLWEIRTFKPKFRARSDSVFALSLLRCCFLHLVIIHWAKDTEFQEPHSIQGD